MRINFDRNFVDCFGQEIADPADHKPSNIARTIAQKLFFLSQINGRDMTQEEKYCVYRMSMELSRNPSCAEISVDDAALLKSVCAGVFSAGAYGQIVDIIENDR